MKTLRLVALALLCTLTACGPAEPPTASTDDAPPVQGAAPDSEASRFRNANTSVEFVGDAACFDCHEDLYQGYQEHGMANSWYRLTAANTVEDFGGEAIYHEDSGFYYRPYREGDRFYQEEYRLDADGRKTHQLVREMQYVVGSGTAARTYLTVNNGRVYELPLTWYTQAEKWDFSPGYEVFNARFDRTVPDRCMACHNSYPEEVPFAPGKYAEVPEGIGCERCHGPGALHVEERLVDPEGRGEYDDTIVNPAHLSLDRRLDVCQQCHLHTSVSLLREGRTPYDFRPAQALAAHVSLYYTDVPPTTEEISVISHADRMKQSACFIASRPADAPMDCTTCHDPHAGFRTKGPEFFNASCMDCHATDELQAELTSEEARTLHTTEANCIDCHMPKVEAEDAPHASFTDHWVRVVRDVPEAKAMPTREPVTLKPYFAVDTGDAVTEGMAYIVYGQQQGDGEALQRGIALLDEALTDVPEAGEAHYLLGFARLQLGEVEAAIPALETAVRLGPNIPERLNTLAQAYEGDGRDAQVIERLYRRALEIQPALATVRVNYGRFLETRGRVDEAMQAYEAAIAEEPWLETAHFNLGAAELQAGDFDRGEALLRHVLELNPDHADALTNLGLLYALQEQPDEAERYFEQAVEADPTNVTALGNLGAYLLNQEREEDLPRAIAVLERAVETDPTYADGLANLALAQFRVGNLTAAEEHARAALAHDPNHGLANQIIAAL